MDASAYFESDPWTEIEKTVRSGTLGHVAEIAVQAVCSPGTLAAVMEAWQRQLENLLGAPVATDVLHVESASSLLARYHGNAIVRLFAEEGADSPAYSVEVVGTEALLLWKPEVHPLARLSLPGREEIAFAHPYASDLAQEAAA